MGGLYSLTVLFAGSTSNAYIGVRSPAFAKAIAERSASIDDVFRTLPEDRVLKLARSVRSKDGPTAAKVIANRWAYFDALEPGQSAQIEQAFASGAYEEWLFRIRMTKHQFVSPISAALGGEYFWTKADREGRKMRFSNLDELRRSSITFGGAEEFAMWKVLSTVPTKIAPHLQPENLLELLSSADFAKRKVRVEELREQAVLMLRRGEVTENTFQEFKRLDQEIREEVEKGRLTGAGRGIASTGVGVLTEAIVPAIAQYFNVSVPQGTSLLAGGALGGAFLEPKLEQYRNWLYALKNPDRHRFLQASKELD